ncbi:MAG: acetyl-CoA C-acyltransferase family protein [Streptosporangiaceae bacterium]|jgi:acetyl-CoA C-acetyltransferase|nr:acetyl-CoA C-acyltransferase [Actinomycetota bacterium]
MTEQNDVVVLSGTRTAIGKYGGALAGVPPCDLAATVVREAVRRSGVDPADFGHAVFGNVIHTQVRDMYLSRVAAVNGGLPVEVPAFTVNRLCGSGLQAIVSASQAIILGDADVAVAGGAESMSRAPYWLPGMRWGQRMGDGVAIDAVVGALGDPWDGCHMGVTAENVAQEFGISREDQDALAVESHRRAAAAVAGGYFDEQITPVQAPAKKGTVEVTADEHIRPDANLEGMARLRPAFAKDGTVTAGNASGMNDAAAAVVLATSAYASSHGLQPMGRLVAYSHAGVEPRIMGIGPVPAVRKVLDRSGLKLDEIDVFEVNEAFAAQALAVIRELGLPEDRTNPNGSGISLGHPVAATGAILTVKALYELKRVSGRYALVTMCIGGGQGIAAIFERL